MMEHTLPQKIRRFIYIGDEVRFLNSNKKYVEVTFIEGQKYPKVRLTNKHKDNCYTRQEFEQILQTKWIKH